ncbi:leucine-rich repeat domain-containing protein [Paraprevotella clara]|uniref:leucine-rich repeat domain-containing protein n=1 Tax=Paraprevotella clara TaxID=454154 RepID=UPI0022E52B5D|nr:leucine-rich repeat domain-containing protein [Paraprevotella clara]
MRKIYLFTFMMLLLVHLKGQAQQITLHVERAGTLHGMINASRLPYITDLKLTGELNGTDISFIRTLVKKNLRFLDLSEARIVEGGAIYYSNYRTSNDIIGSYMFYNPDYSPISPCAISKINLPNSVTGIEEGAFKSCTRLTDINIPNSVTSIGPETFKSCTSLTDINIPNSVTSIGERAFSGCTSLTDINIPNSVTSIEWATFYSCTSLTDINIPNSVTSIGGGAFSGCTSLTDINIPNSVTSIGEQAFYNCDNLKSVYMNASTPPFIGSQAFHNISKDLTIYIPRGSYTAYWLSYWGNYNLVEYDPTDIQGVTTSAHNGVEKYFSIDGRPLPGPCKGVNIIQDTDGKTRKAWIP